jgi:hypothetical protein
MDREKPWRYKTETTARSQQAKFDGQNIPPLTFTLSIYKPSVMFRHMPWL